MTFRKVLGLLIPLLCSANIWADTLRLKANPPKNYTVVKGDTLWDISGKFLKSPWQWPRLWQSNPQIKNPDLIYPGDTLFFSIVDGEPHLSLKRNAVLNPHIREMAINQAIKLIPAEAIAQFLTSPKVVNKTDLAQSPYVVDFAREHIIAGMGDKIYVRSIPQPKSLSYTIYRQGETFVDPDTKEILGYEAKYIADATIERSGDPATLTIIRSNKEVRRGDRLMVSSSSKMDLNFFPRPPANVIAGRIIGILDGVSQIGQHHIVVLNKGRRDGLKSGHTLDIFQRGHVVRDPFSSVKNSVVKLPDEIAGILMVFRVFERVSYALVMEANQPIHLLDIVKTP